MVRGASIPWERNSNFHFEWKLFRCVPEGKKRLCSFGSFSLTLQISFHLCFHAQYAHYSVIHSVWVMTATMPICSGPLLNVFVKTQPCDVTAWVTAVWGKCGWQLCLSKQPDFLLSNVLPANTTCLRETDSCWHGNRVGLLNSSW